MTASAGHVEGPHVRFARPAELTLRTQPRGATTVYRMNHPDFRMELNVMAGELVAVTRAASRTGVDFHPPQAGPLRAEDKRLLGALFLGAIEADTRLEGGELSVLRDVQGDTAGGLRYLERVFLIQSMPVVRQVAVVFGDAPSGAVVAYMTNRANMDEVDAWKDAVLASLELV